MHPILEQYRILAQFLGEVLGPEYEITLHDLSSSQHSIAAIVNGHISGRTVGAPLTDMALRFLKERAYEDSDYKVGYRGVSGKNASIRSSTMFIKNQSGALIGMLCINHDTSKCRSVMDELAQLFHLDPAEAFCPDSSSASLQDNIETFSNSIADLVASTLRTVLDDPCIPKERLTQEEKLEIVDALNQKGVFLLKGAVSEVADQLCSSEASIYRYLSKLNKNTK